MNTSNGKSLYDILQVTPDASPEVIRAAYKSLSTKYHPDRDSSKEAAGKFAQIQKAFETLSDPDRRARYDANGATGSERSSGFSDVVMRVDGSSSHLTVEEHLKRNWKELVECDLSGRSFDGVSFRGANLTKSKLDGSSFVGCDFRQVNLTDCSARNCKFSGAFFGGAQIIRTDFTGSALRGVALFGAKVVWKSTEKDLALRFTNYDRSRSIADNTTETGITKIDVCNFTRCDLTEAQFASPAAKEDCVSITEEGWFGKRSVPGYLIQGFRSCTISESNFSMANMQECDLHGISLFGSTFHETILNGANLKGANIEDVDLSSCSVTNLNLHKVAYSDETLLPEGFRMPENAKKARPAIRMGTPLIPESGWFMPVFLLILVVVLFFGVVIGTVTK